MVSDPVAATDWRRLAAETSIPEGIFIGGERRSHLGTAHRVSRALRAGTVWVNCYEEGDMAVPFGGVKLSGFGRDKSRHALEEYTYFKTTWIRYG
jgi:acyl-CoA reductase-like NAD-dependent aldehyde dehydrogenase